MTSTDPLMPAAGHGIYYNTSNNLLIVSSNSGLGPNNGLVTSSDNGVSWHKALPETWYTGFAFSDAMHGIVATDSTNCTGSINAYWYRTFDGGVTWQRTFMSQPSWQPRTTEVETTSSLLGFI